MEKVKDREIRIQELEQRATPTDPTIKVDTLRNQLYFNVYKCPVCDNRLTKYQNYCDFCGQAMRWKSDR